MVSRGSGVRATCFLWLAAVLVSSAQGPGRSAQAPVADVASLVAQMWAIPHTRAEWRAEAHLKVQIRTQMRATGAYRASRATRRDPAIKGIRLGVKH